MYVCLRYIYLLHQPTTISSISVPDHLYRQSSCGWGAPGMA